MHVYGVVSDDFFNDLTIQLATIICLRSFVLDYRVYTLLQLYRNATQRIAECEPWLTASARSLHFVFHLKTILWLRRIERPSKTLQNSEQLLLCVNTTSPMPYSRVINYRPLWWSGCSNRSSKLVVCMCVRTITFELSDLWPRYLARWFILTRSRSNSKVKVTEQKLFLFFRYRCTLRCDVFLVVCLVLCSKMVGATSNEGFLVKSKAILHAPHNITVFSEQVTEYT